VPHRDAEGEVAVGLGIMRIIHPIKIGDALAAGAFKLPNPDE